MSTPHIHIILSTLNAIYSGDRFAIERTTTYINVWFWPQNVGNPPADVRNPVGTVNTANWVRLLVGMRNSRAEKLILDAQGTPFANFPNTQCDIASMFGPHNIIINLTFCSYLPRSSLAHLSADSEYASMGRR